MTICRVGTGDDLLSGGLGNDRMIGGLGSDTFVWTSEDVLNELGKTSFDRIGEFSSVDILDFSQLSLDSELNLDQLVMFEENDRGTVVSVNLGDARSDFTELALLQNMFDANVEKFVEADMLII